MIDTEDAARIQANRVDRIMAKHINNAGNIVSGLNLSEIGEDGHEVANLLWKISSYLKRRNDGKTN